jgi:hypothetical protein
MTASPEMFARVAFAKESSFKVAGAYTNAKGLLSPVTITPGRERIKRDDALNSRGDVYADEHGRQTYSAQLSYYLTANSYADLKTLFTAALGAENAATTLTFSSTATNLGVNISGGGAAALIKTTGNNGLTYFVAVDTSAANLLTYFPSLPSGVTTTACSNLSGNSGGVFDFDDEGEACDTFSIESDWSAKPSTGEQEVILAKGAVITTCKLNYEKDKLLSFTVGFGMAAEYTEVSGPATQCADPGVWTVPFLGWAGDWFLSAPSQGSGAGYLINDAGGYDAGVTTVAVDTGTGTILVGDTVTFAGVTGEYVVTAALASNSFSFLPPLAGAVADNAAVSLVGIPTWASTKTPVKKLDVEMAKEVLTETGSNGLDGGSSSTSTLPGSDIKGYTANGGYKGDVTVLVPYDPKWPTRFKAKVPTRLFGVMYPGVPNGAALPSNRAVLYIRRLIPVGRPVIVPDGGVKCQQLTFMIERDLTTNTICERLHFGLSN